MSTPQQWGDMDRKIHGFSNQPVSMKRGVSGSAVDILKNNVEESDWGRQPVSTFAHIFMCTVHVHAHRKKCFPIGTVVPPSMPDNTFLYLFVSYSYYHHNSIKYSLSPSLMYSWKKQVLRSLTEVIYLLSRDEIKTRIPRPHFHVLLPYCLRDACTQKAVWRV